MTRSSATSAVSTPEITDSWSSLPDVPCAVEVSIDEWQADRFCARLDRLPQSSGITAGVIGDTQIVLFAGSSTKLRALLKNLARTYNFRILNVGILPSADPFSEDLLSQFASLPDDVLDLVADRYETDLVELAEGGADPWSGPAGLCYRNALLLPDEVAQAIEEDLFD